jgi:hypothetical protein
MLLHDAAQDIFIADQQDIQLRLPNSLYRPGYHLFRAQLATHGIQGNTQCHVLLHLVFKLDYRSVLVGAAAAAKPVRQLRLTALGAARNGRGSQRIMGSPFPRP